MSRILLVPVVARPPAWVDTSVTSWYFPLTEDPYLLGEVSHGEGLIEKPEFPLLALLVVGVTENATVQQRSVNIGHHRPDIPSRVRRLARGREFNRVEIVDHWRVEVDRIPFVEGINLSSGRDTDLHADQTMSVKPRGVSEVSGPAYDVRQGE
jgi:hypothetical protein